MLLHTHDATLCFFGFSFSFYGLFRFGHKNHLVGREKILFDLPYTLLVLPQSAHNHRIRTHWTIIDFSSFSIHILYCMCRFSAESCSIQSSLSNSIFTPEADEVMHVKSAALHPFLCAQTCIWMMNQKQIVILSCCQLQSLEWLWTEEVSVWSGSRRMTQTQSCFPLLLSPLRCREAAACFPQLNDQLHKA